MAQDIKLTNYVIKGTINTLETVGAERSRSISPTEAKGNYAPPRRFFNTMHEFTVEHLTKISEMRILVIKETKDVVSISPVRVVAEQMSRLGREEIMNLFERVNPSIKPSHPRDLLRKLTDAQLRQFPLAWNMIIVGQTAIAIEDCLKFDGWSTEDWVDQINLNGLIGTSFRLNHNLIEGLIPDNIRSQATDQQISQDIWRLMLEHKSIPWFFESLDNTNQIPPVFYATSNMFIPNYSFVLTYTEAGSLFKDSAQNLERYLTNKGVKNA